MKKGFINNGFTLAEVLITLAIIGVVAALTIPTVVQNYQKTQVITQLKKTYAALANTTNLAIADEGPVSGWEIGTSYSGQAAIDFANRYLIPYLKVARNCETKTTGECEFKYSYLNNTGPFTLNETYTRFFLNDGSFLAVYIRNDETLKMAGIFIDVNGQKAPNKFGRDMFYYIYYVERGGKVVGIFMPSDYNRTRENLVLSEDEGVCNKNASNWSGRYCAALIMKDSWQIKDDYPW